MGNGLLSVFRLMYKMWAQGTHICVLGNLKERGHVSLGDKNPTANALKMCK